MSRHVVRGTSGPSPSHPDKRMVLVADDDEGVRRLIGAILVRLGRAAEYCCDGREALVKATRGTHSLVILDCEMPLMTGPEVARELRERGQNVPVILMSGGDLDEVAASLGELPRVTFLPKPFGLAEFCEAVEEAEVRDPLENPSALPRSEGGRA